MSKNLKQQTGVITVWLHLKTKTNNNFCGSTAPSGGFALNRQSKTTPLSLSAHFFVLPAETLPWRRVADLHVMLSGAFVAMLVWRLERERLTELFQQEEGRYTVLLFTPLCLYVLRSVHFISVFSPLKRIVWSHVDGCLASPVSPLWKVKMSYSVDYSEVF